MTPKQARRASLAALVAVERAAKARLSASVREASDRAEVEIASGRDPHSSLVAALLLLEWLLTRDLTLTRRAARREAVRTFQLEARACGLPSLALRLRDDETLDESRVVAAAKALAALWLARATAFLVGEGSNPARAPSAATEAVRPRVETTARTEPAHAFGDEKDGLSDDYAAEIERRRREDPKGATAGLYPIPMKVWDATLDWRTCRVCKALDGTIVPFGTDFPRGEIPGDVHPNCRCAEGIVSLLVSDGADEAA